MRSALRPFLTRLGHSRFGRVKARRLYMTSCDSPEQFSVSDVGRLYKIPKEEVDALSCVKLLPKYLIKQNDTLGELVTVIREPLIEVSVCMNAIRQSFPALRLVLWGPFGTGKTVTLNQAVHLAYKKNMVIVQLQSALALTRGVKEVEMSTFKHGRINDPVNAVTTLQFFKDQNQHIWKTLSGLKTERDYEWTKIERTAVDRPITDIVEMGLSAPFLATDCVGALFRELRRHSSAGNITMFVAIDDANSLWGKTTVKKADRSYASPSELSLVNHFRNLISPKWQNGCILLVADKKELSDPRDSVTVPRHTPLELFGEEGFQFIEPFLPIETKQYTKDEVSNLYQYYYDKRWLSTEKARTEDGKLQLMYLSAFNPYYFERLCAFN
uniref:Small ribosomal subunit protein mS29 n=1 Tax=Haemonchus contortus TaxID=6289 RepID=W6NPR2_HAECO